MVHIKQYETGGKVESIKKRNVILRIQQKLNAMGEEKLILLLVLVTLRRFKNRIPKPFQYMNKSVYCKDYRITPIKNAYGLTFHPPTS